MHIKATMCETYYLQVRIYLHVVQDLHLQRPRNVQVSF